MEKQKQKKKGNWKENKMYLENKIRKRNKGIKYCLQTAAMVESSTRQYLKKLQCL
jgi:hypothetical protein